MRKVVVSIVAAVVLVAAAAAVGTAGKEPRLKYKVTGTVTGTDIAGLKNGDKTHDTYTFLRLCTKKKKPCDKFSLTRKDGLATIKSIVNRIAPGVYKGKEGPAAYTCITPLGNAGSYTGTNKIKVKVVKKTAGKKVTTISGTSKISFTGCKETFENQSIVGKEQK